VYKRQPQGCLAIIFLYMFSSTTSASQSRSALA